MLRTAKYIVIIHSKLSIRKIEFGGKSLPDSVLGFILVRSYKRKFLNPLAVVLPGYGLRLQSDNLSEVRLEIHEHISLLGVNFL